MGRHTVLSHECEQAIHPAQVTQILARSQISGVKPYRLFIDERFAMSFMILDVRVGRSSMFPQSQRVPATKFMHGKGEAFDCDELPPCTDFVMVVENIGKQSMPFLGTWSCVVVPPKPRYLDRAQQAALLEAWHSIVGTSPVMPPDANEDLDTRIAHVPEVAPLPRARALPARASHPGFGWDPYGD